MFRLMHCRDLKTYIGVRFFSDSLKSLKGRDLYHPSQLSSSDVKKLLWTAFELKIMNMPVPASGTHHISLIMRKSSLNCQMAFQVATSRLNSSMTTYMNRQWDESFSMIDAGNLAGHLSDAIVTCGLKQEDVALIADGARVPVVGYSSDLFNLVDSLSYLMTLMEELGPLRRRVLAWVGPKTHTCITMLYLAPLLNLDLRIFLTTSSDESYQKGNLDWERGIRQGRGFSHFHECSSIEEAVYRADAVVTTNHGVPGHNISASVLEEASLNWFFIHTLPRTAVEVSDDVFQHKNNLTWKSVGNSRFIAMAMLQEVLSSYVNTSPMPDFQGPL